MTTDQEDNSESLEHEAPQPAKPTPLPMVQLLITLLVQFSEPVTALVIYPFINQLVRDTGINKGDETKTGYYAGVIVSDVVLPLFSVFLNIVLFLLLRNLLSSWPSV